MIERPIWNAPASVHQRLLNKVRETGRTFNELLRYYAMERFLYRLFRAPYGEKFVLKGALMVWKVSLFRPTTDIDFLGKIQNDIGAICAIMRKVCEQKAEPDGMTFDASSVSGGPIAEDAEYNGVRVSLKGRLGNARVVLQMDIGFGDVSNRSCRWLPAKY